MHHKYISEFVITRRNTLCCYILAIRNGLVRYYRQCRTIRRDDVKVCWPYNRYCRRGSKTLSRGVRTNGRNRSHTHSCFTPSYALFSFFRQSISNVSYNSFVLVLCYECKKPHLSVYEKFK